jgi:Zn finger protein HypA/HybF involved in hydrogenase expression
MLSDENNISFESHANAKVWCRDCGKEMEKSTFSMTYYCKKCKLKAEVSYGDIPIIRAI